MPEKLFKTKYLCFCHDQKPYMSEKGESSGYFLSPHLKEHPIPGNHLTEAPGNLEVNLD